MGAVEFFDKGPHSVNDWGLSAPIRLSGQEEGVVTGAGVPAVVPAEF
jgi:hypothetical protein